MRRWLFFSAMLALMFAIAVAGTSALMRNNRGALPAGAGLSVPSGQAIVFLDRTTDAAGGAGQAGEGLSHRFRFIAPAIARIGGAVDVETAQRDMAHLCEAMRAVLESEGQAVPDQIVIALADRETAAGSIDPEVTKYFEAFRIESDACAEEVF